MDDHKLHIVCFDIPYPATYGGAIDVFYRIKALHRFGVRIILHCTYKGELVHYEELESLCEKVYYYHRTMSLNGILSRLPIAVVGRKNDEILNNLLEDEAPILYEGLVSCGTIAAKELKARKKFFRECNVEHDYFRGLAKASRSWHKLYYLLEACRLEKFENVLSNASAILSLAHQDEEHFKKKFPDIPVTYIPCFHASSKITSWQGTGKGILYHGNLQLAENAQALRYILKHIVSQLPDIPFIIAGRCNAEKWQKRIKAYSNVTLVPNPDEETMWRLIHEAQINLLVTFQNTGLKLKLLNVAFAGRHIICNHDMVGGTELGKLCHVENSPHAIIDRCKALYNEPMTEYELKNRSNVLHDFDNKHLAVTLHNTLFDYQP